MLTPERFAEALDFAAQVHADQGVPGTELPYVVHVVKVATELLLACVAEGRSTADTDLGVTVALLHDTVEDTEVTLRELSAAFGVRVAAGVGAMSKDERLPKSERMADSLRRLLEQPTVVQAVKLADRIVNLAPPPPAWSAARCREYQQEARLIVEILGGASPFLAQRLQARIEAYGEYVRQREALTGPTRS